MHASRQYRNRYRRANYRQTAGYPRREWTQYEIDLVLAHTMSDRQLSAKICRSVQSIQMTRWRVKSSQRR